MAKPDFQRAAVRHLQDACLLRDNSRWTNAAYLSGYAVECALKALVVRAGRIPPHIHDLSRLKRLVKDIAGGRAKRLNGIVRHPFLLPIPVPLNFDNFEYPAGTAPVQEWHPSLRYQPEGVIPEAVANAWVEGARQFHGRTIHRLEKYGENRS